MSVIAKARTRFLAERPAFVQLADQLEQALIQKTRAAGIPCAVKGRAKDVSSFVGKCLRKSYSDPWSQITDKVGVRVTVDNPADIERVVELIRDDYEIIEHLDKTLELWNADKVGYGGTHLQIVVPNDQNVSGSCEIQIRSAAQNLWSEMSHRLLYKPGVEPDDGTKRALTRLAALMEIFDEEVMRRVSQLTAAPGYHIEELINLTESIYYEHADCSYNRALSRYVLSEIGPTLPSNDAPTYADTLRAFAAENSEKLDSIYLRYANIDDPVLIHQPESVIVFERIAHEPFLLRTMWEKQLPTDELEQLEAIWGA